MKVPSLPIAATISGGEESLIIQSGEVLRGSVAMPALLDAAFGRGASVQTDGAARIAIALAGGPIWGNALTGDDADNGGGPAAPKQSLEAVLASAAQAAPIALSGSSPFHLGPNKFTDGNAIVAVDGRAVIDARKELVGAAWAADAADDCFRLSFTIDEASEPAGISADSFHFAVWVDGRLIEWKFEGADIAANEAACAAAPGLAFTIHKTGSTAPDPRYDSAGTDFDLFLKCDPGFAPGDYRSIKVTNQKTKLTLQGGSAANLSVLGNHGKDGFGAVLDVAGTTPHLHNVEGLDMPGHFTVGLFTTSGNYRARGRGIEGRFGPAEPFNNNRTLYWSHQHEGETVYRKLSNSGGLVHFTPEFAAALDITHESVDVENFDNAIFAHRGSGADQIARALLIRALRVNNCGEILQCGGANGKRAFEDFVRIDHLVASKVDNGFNPGSDLFIGGGHIAFVTARDALRSVNNPTFSASFDAFRTATDRGQVHEFRDLTWLQPREIDNLNSDAFWIFNKDPVTPVDGSNHIQRFIDCADISPPDRAFHLERTATFNPVELQLIRTKLGPLHPSNVATLAGVSKITAKGGSVLGWKDMNRADALADMAALGIATDIDADTAFIDRNGLTLG